MKSYNEVWIAVLFVAVCWGSIIYLIEKVPTLGYVSVILFVIIIILWMHRLENKKNFKQR